MRHFQQLIATVFFVLLLVIFPLSAHAASSSSITRSAFDQELNSKDYSNQNLQTAEFTNVKLEKANFSNSDLRGAVFNSTAMNQANLHGADFTYGIAYLVDFTGADLSDAVFIEAMLLRSRFENTDVTGTDFTNAVLDGAQVRKLCAQASGVNSKTGVSTRESLGCR